MASKRVLVVGLGNMGMSHALAYTRIPGVEVAGVCTRHINDVKLPEALANAQKFTDFDTALAALKPDIVSINTLPDTHADYAIKAMEAGAHVFVEKPLSIDLAGTDQLLAARDRARRFAAVAYVHHANPALQAARDFIRSGRFGAVRHVVVTSGHNFPAARPAYREIYYRDHAQGGGAIQDALTHLVNAAEWIVGPTTRVFADASHQVLEGVEVEDTVSIAARNGGIVASYAINQFQAPNESTYQFNTAKGSVKIELHRRRWGVMRLGDPD